MGLFFRAKHDPAFQISLCRVLDFFWIVGLISGAGTSLYAGDSFVSTMHAAASRCVSISGLLSVLLLPLLFSAFAVYICQIRLLIPIVFAKAFCFSFIATAVGTAFGAAGWLVKMLLLFSSTASLSVLWWFWYRMNTTRRDRILSDFVTATTAIAVIAAFDHWLIAPFLAGLIS